MVSAGTVVRVASVETVALVALVESVALVALVETVALVLAALERRVAPVGSVPVVREALVVRMVREAPGAGVVVRSRARCCPPSCRSV